MRWIVGVVACAACASTPPTIENRIPTGRPLDDTGFDLFVIPSSGTSFKLDGKLHPEFLPARVVGVAPGSHTIELLPPPQYLGHIHTVDIAPGEWKVVEIRLRRAP